MPILPIDAGRYITPEMKRIFDEEAYLQRLLDVEASLASAWADLGLYPKKYAKAIKAKAEACFTIDQMPKKKSENQRYSFKCKFCPGFQKVLEACSVRSNTSCGAIFMARQ